MQKVTFKLKNHAIRDVQIVEIYVNGNFRGALYPGDTVAGGVRLISRHLSIDPVRILESNDDESAVWQFLFKP